MDMLTNQLNAMFTKGQRMQLEINVIDAFADTVFKGNSAAVIITDNWLGEDLMQSIAMENNLSETAFLVPDESNEKKEITSRAFSQRPEAKNPRFQPRFWHLGCHFSQRSHAESRHR